MPSVAAILDTEQPDWRKTGWICRSDLRKYRRKAIEHMLKAQRGRLTEIDRMVAESVADRDLMSNNVEEIYQERISFGDRLSDKIAEFAGSWPFIIIFVAAIIAWMVLNLSMLVRNPFDPYPFILLNLVLSCVAALQAPLIMMSQGRQEAKDRLRSENDYRVNLKAELEIRHLHEIIDHHLTKQWERLSQLQEMQLELFDEVTRSRRR